MDNRNRTKLCETCKEEPATVLCSECCMCYCDKCSAFMHSKEFKKDHKTEAFPDGVVVEARCPLHKDAPLEMFCIDKTRLCCINCKKENIYDGCKVVKLSDIAQDNEVFSASKVKAYFADALGYCEELEKEVESVADNVVNEGNNVREKIKQLFIREHEKLVEEEMRLMDELEKACNEHEEALQKNLTDFRDVCGYGRLLCEADANMRGGDNSRLMELNIVSEMEKQLVPMENLYKMEMSNLKIKWAEEERKLTFTKSLFNGVPIPSNIQVSSVLGSKVAITWSCDDSKLCEENKSKTRYIVMIKKSSGNEWGEVYSGISKECTITGLLPATEYIIFVKCAVGELQGRLGSYVKVKTRKKSFEISCWIECPNYVDKGKRKYDVDKENPRVATMDGDDGCTIIGNTYIPLNTVTSWSVKILKSMNDDCDDILIGVAPSDINQDEVNYDKCGWYFYCSDSSLWSGPPHKHSNKEYGPRKEYGEYVHTGDAVGVIIDTTKGDLSFVLNNVNLGVAYEGIPLDKPLVPCVILCNEGDSVELDTSEVEENKVDSSIPVPSNITAEDITWDSITLTWDEVSDASFYQIEVDGNKSWDAVTINPFIKDGLFPDTEHSFRVRTVRGSSVSEWSGVVKGRTLKTLEFSECTWKECPDYVDEEREYDVNIVNYRTAKKIDDDNSYCTIVGDAFIPLNKVTSWIIKIHKSKDNGGGGIFIGIAPSNINQDKGDNYTCGWYYNCYSSSLWSGPPHNYSGKKYGQRGENGKYVRRGNGVGVVMDTAKGELSFIINRVKYGVAYEGIPLDEPLVPCVLLKYKGDSVGLNTSKAKETVINAIPVPSNIILKSSSWDSITIAWEPVEKASFYQIEVDGSRVLEASTGNTFTKKGILPADEHSFRIRTVRGSAASKWSDVVKGRTLKTPEFSGCVWKECPSYVDENRKYSVNWFSTRIATKINGCNFCTIVGTAPIPFNITTKWDIKILKSNGACGIYVGIAPFDVNQNDHYSYDEFGWYLNCFCSTLYSGLLHNYYKNIYGPRKENGQYVHEGDSVGVVMDTIKGELSFVLNGVNLGVAYKGIPLDKPLVPCVILYNEGDSVELVI